MTEERLERRVVSVLFADIVGFTSLSEGLDAEDVSAVQDQYFADVRDVIGRYGGRLEKFIGDAAMAVFGVPRARDDDAERAVRAGLALVRSMEALPARIGLDEGALRLRVGVNSGEVAYAPADDGQWRVSGDAVNVAARLQTAAEPGTVLIGDTTALAVADVIAIDAPVELELKGKSGSVRAWRAVTPLPQRSRERAMGSLHAPLLGRERELAQIAAVVDRVRRGASETLIVVAPPGVGKTRLVEELANRAGQRGSEPSVSISRARLGPDTISVAAAVTQLLVAALDAHMPPTSVDTPVPEIPRVRLVGDILRQALPAERANELIAEMTRLLTETESTAAPAPAAASDLEAEREIRFRAWIEALDALESAGPHIWLVEDLHWSGGDLLAFVEQASLQPASRGRLVLATARPSLLDQLAQRPAGAAPLPVLELRPLADDNARDLVAALVGDALPAPLTAAGFLIDDRAAEVWEIADRAEEITRRRGSQEDLAWIEYLRAEAGFVAGDWDRALAAGMRAMEIGERNAYHRVAVRTWHVLLPIAEARGDRALLEHGYRWYTARAGTFPDSPYARIVEGAANVHFMRAGLLPAETLEVAPRLGSFSGEPGGPSWVDAIETVFETWLAEAELAGARSAHQRLAEAVDRHPECSMLGRGVERHLLAALLAAEGAAPGVVSGPAREATALFRIAKAPWWIARSLRVLGDAGDGGQVEADELAAIEGRLKVRGSR